MELEERSSFYSKRLSDIVQERVIIAMVGLPARGKSFMSKAIMRYCNFLGVACRQFNAGSKRREQGKAGEAAAFFDSQNKEAHQLKEKIAMETLDELLKWLDSVEGMACGIFDATNTTQERRLAVLQRCAQSPGVILIFLESICNDEAILRQNYELKMSNEDYKGTEDKASALEDFLNRVRAYEKVYDEITDGEVAAAVAHSASLPPLRYIQVIDAGKKMVVSQLDGDSVICKWVVQLINSIHLSTRKLSIVIAGESVNDRDGIRGGDSSLSEEGVRYAEAVIALLKQRIDPGREPPVMLTGTLRRYEQMVAMCYDISRRVLPLPALNELCFGSLEGLRAGSLRTSFPEEYAAREADKLHYRYPGVGGQGYFDLIMQMQSALVSIEASRRDSIIVCDVAVARVLLGYFDATPVEQIPEIPVSPGIIELTRTHSGFTRTTFTVDTGTTRMLHKMADQ